MQRTHSTLAFPPSFSLPKRDIFKSSTGNDEKFDGFVDITKNKNSRKRKEVSVERETLDGNYSFESDNNESKNDESFSSFLPSSIGAKITKSFDWAFEQSSMQPFRSLFDFDVLYISPPERWNRTGFAATEQKQEPSDEEEEELTQISPEASTDDHADEKPYVPLRLSMSCEYCGSPSIRDCGRFNPNCQRPKTFFRKAKFPFGCNTVGYTLYH